ncbi:MAG: SDR family oxidoreductase [Methylococcaceae bacterium]|nr:SDR family oxidoreductase [Methylococcaceae bacterium]
MNEPQKARTALVTGGSRGIGHAIAAALIDGGYRVAVGYLNNRAMAEELCRGHDAAIPLQIDINSERLVETAFKQISAELGPVDILINNAGISQIKPFLELTDDDWETMLSTNLLGAVRCCRQAIPGMLTRRYGRIVNLSSVGGQWGGIYQVHYAAAKAGLINFTKSLAKLYSQQGICSNAVAPGLIDTDMIVDEMTDEQARARVAGIPMGRLGTPDEVASLVAYLCSDQASYISGQTFNVNGGMYLLG